MLVAQEGPHSRLNEEEFYDAVDAALDKLEKEDENKMSSLVQVKATTPPATSLDPNHPLYNEVSCSLPFHIVNVTTCVAYDSLGFVCVQAAASHLSTLFVLKYLRCFQINACVVEHFRTADMSASDIAQTWTLVMEEGDLKVYKKETVEDGILIEPHKAVYTTTVSTAMNNLFRQQRVNFVGRCFYVGKYE